MFKITLHLHAHKAPNHPDLGWITLWPNKQSLLYYEPTMVKTAVEYFHMAY